MTAIKSGVSKRQKDKMLLKRTKEQYFPIIGDSRRVGVVKVMTPEEAYANFPTRGRCA